MNKKLDLGRALCALIFLALSACLCASAAAFSFTPGHIYTTTYFSLDIMEYYSDGAFVDSITLSSRLGSETRGIVFGPNNLLYVAMVTDSGFSVYALDSTGTPHERYSGDTYIAGNLSFGKIAMDNRFLYVCGQNDLVRFRLGRPSTGHSIYTNNQVFDVKPLRNGRLFVASAYAIDEITANGTLVRNINVTGGPFLVDVRGIEYDRATDNLFVTMLGYTDFYDQLMRINASTGQFEQSVTFSYGDDLFFTDSDTLLVGSRTDTPRIYGEDLTQLGTVGSTARMFITQYNGP